MVLRYHKQTLMLFGNTICTTWCAMKIKTRQDQLSLQGLAAVINQASHSLLTLWVIIRTILRHHIKVRIIVSLLMNLDITWIQITNTHLKVAYNKMVIINRGVISKSKKITTRIIIITTTIDRTMDIVNMKISQIAQ
jgi:hypothetical protein